MQSRYFALHNHQVASDSALCLRLKGELLDAIIASEKEFRPLTRCYLNGGIDKLHVDFEGDDYLSSHLAPIKFIKFYLLWT